MIDIKEVEVLADYYMTTNEIKVNGEIGIDFEPDLRNDSSSDETISSTTFNVYNDQNEDVTTNFCDTVANITGTVVSRKVDATGASVVSGRDYWISIEIIKSGGGYVEEFLGLHIQEPDFRS